MVNIFDDIFKSLFGDNPLALSSSKNEKPASSKDSVVGRLVPFLYNEIKGKVKKPELASDNTKKIDKKIKKDKEVSVDRLYSKRFYSKGSDGNYTDNDAKKASLDEYSGETEVEIPSTAIADVKYNPKEKVCHVKYVGGDKWYRFVNMSPQQFKSFMMSSSKGRYVQKVMRKKNHDPAYPVTV